MKNWVGRIDTNDSSQVNLELKTSELSLISVFNAKRPNVTCQDFHNFQIKEIVAILQ